MSEIIEEVRLILSDVGQNSNKYWVGRLFDSNDVETEWGRVGVTKDSKLFPGKGKSFFDKKKNEKLKKGYTELRTVASGTTKTQTVSQGNLQDIARKQIQTTKPQLQKLIDRLVAANVHQITSNTQIKYDAGTGLFTTPLGIVTLDAIQEARDFLVDIQPFIKKGDHANKKLFELTGKYLRLVPQNVGMKLDTRTLFPDDDSLKKQSDLLDSLESSYKALQSTPAKDDSQGISEEKVFDVSLDVVEDQREVDRINKFYRSTANGSHASYRLGIVKVYKLQLKQMAEGFETGKKAGNIQELWHGTKKANLLSILKSGLRVSPPNTAAIAGKMFGNGIYFSDQSTKSLNYAYGYWDGKYEKDCFMLLSDVAMGKSYTPSAYGDRHSLPRPGYDSTFAKGGQSGVSNNEMIVYRDNQVNIKYLVEFKE